MSKSTKARRSRALPASGRSPRDGLAGLLAAMSRRARSVGLNDTAWAARAGVRKETLSRLRRRTTCDLDTLQALARAVGTSLTALEVPLPALTADGHFPGTAGRDFEESLVEFCAGGDLDPDRWRTFGPPFFMAGLAVMLAGTGREDRGPLLALAEHLHPGASEPPVFERWLARSPVRPSDFLPRLAARARRGGAARAG